MKAKAVTVGEGEWMNGQGKREEGRKEVTGQAAKCCKQMQSESEIVGAAEMDATPSHAPCRKCNKYLNCLMLFTFTPTFRFTPTFTFRFTFVIAFAFAVAPAGPIVHRFMQISA